jgi:Na+/proline symporter
MVVASTFVRDVYEKLIHSGESLREEKKLRMSRYVVIFSGILAMVLAYLAEESIYWLILFSWGGLGASLGPPLIFSLYWKKANGYGIVAGMVTGMAVTFIWRLFLKEVTGLYELIPAFFCSCFAVVLVSLITKGDQGNVLSAERDPSGEV